LTILEKACFADRKYSSGQLPAITRQSARRNAFQKPAIRLMFDEEGGR
jgi:hypothetical protein